MRKGTVGFRALVEENSMQDNRAVPVALQIVAILFIIGGVCAALEMLVGVTHGRISVNFGVLGIFIGPGLMRFSPGWRTCALVFTWISLIGVPLFAILVLFSGNRLHVNVFGFVVGNAPPGVGLVVASALFGITLWQYGVLTRADVKQLFGV